MPEFQLRPRPGTVPTGARELEEALRVLKKLALLAVAAGTLAAVRKRSSGKAEVRSSRQEADLWHEATTS